MTNIFKYANLKLMSNYHFGFLSLQSAVEGSKCPLCWI